MPTQLEQTERARGMMGNMSDEERLAQYYAGLEQAQSVIDSSTLWRRDRKLYDKLYGNYGYKWVDSNQVAPDFGSSKFDKKATLGSQAADPTDLRASEQSWYGKLGNDLIKAGGLTVSTAINLASAIFQIPTVAFNTENYDGNFFQRWGKAIVNSQVTKDMIELEELMEQTFPNYRSHLEQDRFWLKNALPFSGGAANFWFDDILKNFGFSYGSMAAAKLATKGVRGVTRLVGAAGKKSTFKLYESIGQKAVRDEMKGIIANNALSVSQKEEAIKTLVARQTRRNLADEIVGSTLGAIGEAQYEGARQMYDFVEKNTQLFDEFLEENPDYIQRMYQKNKPKNIDGTPMSYDDYYTQVYNEAIDQIYDSALAAGQGVFAAEIPLLSIENFLVFRKFFSNGFSTIGKKFNNNFINKLLPKVNIQRSTTDKTIQKITQSNWSKFQNSRTYNIGKAMIGEGVFEEMGQSFINAYNEYMKGSELNSILSQTYNAVLNEEYNDQLQTRMKGFNYAWKQSYGNPDDWVEGFAGGIMGLGMPTIRRRRNVIKTTDKDGNRLSKWQMIKQNIPFTIEWAGGISDWKEAQDRQKLLEQSIETVNQYYTDPEYRAKYQKVLKLLAYDNLKQKAVLNGDRMSYKDNDFLGLIGLAEAFNNLGILKDYQEIIDTLDLNIDEDQFTQLKESGQVEEDMTFKEFQQRAPKVKEAIQKAFKDYDNVRREVTSLAGNRTSQKSIDLLTSMLLFARNKSERVNQMYSELMKMLDNNDRPQHQAVNEIQQAEQLMAFIDYDKLLEKINNVSQNGEISKEQRQQITKKFIDDIAVKGRFKLTDVEKTKDFAEKAIDTIQNAFDVMKLMDDFSFYIQNPQLLDKIEAAVQKMVNNVNQPQQQQSENNTSVPTPEQYEQIQTDAYIDALDKLEKDIKNDNTIETALKNQLLSILNTVQSKDDIDVAIQEVQATFQDILSSYDPQSEMYQTIKRFAHNLEQAVIPVFRKPTIVATEVYNNLVDAVKNFTKLMTEQPTSGMTKNDLQMTDSGYETVTKFGDDVEIHIGVDFIAHTSFIRIVDNKQHEVYIPISDDIFTDTDTPKIIQLGIQESRAKMPGIQYILFKDPLIAQIRNVLLEQGASADETNHIINTIKHQFETEGAEGNNKTRFEQYFRPKVIQIWQNVIDNPDRESEHELFQKRIDVFNQLMRAINEFESGFAMRSNESTTTESQQETETPVESLNTSENPIAPETPGNVENPVINEASVTEPEINQSENPVINPIDNEDLAIQAEQQPEIQQESTEQDNNINENVVQEQSDINVPVTNALTDEEEGELAKTLDDTVNGGKTIIPITEYDLFNNSNTNSESVPKTQNFLQKLLSGLRSIDPEKRKRVALLNHIHKLCKKDGIYNLYNYRLLKTGAELQFAPITLQVTADYTETVIGVYSKLTDTSEPILCGYVLPGTQQYEDISNSGTDGNFFKLKGVFENTPMRGAVHKVTDNNRTVFDDGVDMDDIQNQFDNNQSYFICFRTENNVYIYDGDKYVNLSKPALSQMILNNKQDIAAGVVYVFTHREGKIPSNAQSIALSDFSYVKCDLRPFKKDDGVLTDVVNLISKKYKNPEIKNYAGLNAVLRNSIAFQLPKKKRVNTTEDLDGNKKVYWEVDNQAEKDTCTLQIVNVNAGKKNLSPDWKIRITTKGIDGLQYPVDGYTYDIPFESVDQFTDYLVNDLHVVPSITKISIMDTMTAEDENIKFALEFAKEHLDMRRLVKDGLLGLYQELVPFNVNYTFVLGEKREKQVTRRVFRRRATQKQQVQTETPQATTEAPVEETKQTDNEQDKQTIESDLVTVQTQENSTSLDDVFNTFKEEIEQIDNEMNNIDFKTACIELNQDFLSQCSDELKQAIKEASKEDSTTGC
jgi:hypothetical protein